MTDDYFTNFEDRTYDDLCKAVYLIEKNEVSDERSMKIYLLRMFCEINRLRLKLNGLAFLHDLPPQYDLSLFFGSTEEEHHKRLILLKKRLDRLWKLDREARARNKMSKFNFKRLEAQYA